MIEHLMQKDNKMMNLVTQVRGEGLLGLFQEVRQAHQQLYIIVHNYKLDTYFPKGNTHLDFSTLSKTFDVQEKKKFQSSFDNSFLEESKSGNQAIDLFLDRANPYNKVLHFLACS